MQALNTHFHLDTGVNISHCLFLREKHSHIHHPTTLDNTKQYFQIIEIAQADRHEIDMFMEKNLDERNYFSDLSHAVTEIYGDKTIITAKITTDPEDGWQQLLFSIHSGIEDFEAIAIRENQLFDVLWDIEAWRNAFEFITITHCHYLS